MTQEIEVIRQVLEGDIESFGRIVERYEKSVVRIIRNMTNNRESCEDIAQDVFFTAYKKLASFDPGRSNFSTWLFTIARNKSINAMKKKRPVSMGELPEKINPHNPSDKLAEREFFDRFDMYERAQLMATYESRSEREWVVSRFPKRAPKGRG